MHSNTPSRHLVRGLILTSLVSLVLLTVAASADTARAALVTSVQEFLRIATPNSSVTSIPNRVQPSSRITLGVFETNAVQPIFLGPNDLYWNTNGISGTWTATNWGTGLGG